MQKLLGFGVFVLAFFHLELHGLTINRLNGGNTITYVDFSIPGSVVPLELIRSYNSLTAVNEANGWSGAFGWGWTSAFETALTLTPERTVLLRDGGTGNTVVFRPEKEDPKIKEMFFENLKKAYFEQKMKKKLSATELGRLQMPNKMLSRLKTDPQFRMEMALKYKLKGDVPKGELLISSEYGYQTIQFKNNRWVREKDGVTQIFDQEGRMIRQADKNGFYFDYKFSPTQKLQLKEIQAQDKSVSLKFSWRQERVIEVVDNKGVHARYSYTPNGNLAQVTDSNNQTYIYKYENKRFPHLLTRINYPTESTSKQQVYREIRYDENGLTIFHRDKDGSEIQLAYGKNSQDPENAFSTKAIRKQSGVTVEEFDEFFTKAKADGSKYLYKQESKQNGVNTTTIFASCCGRPQQIVRNGETTNFKYNESGLLIQKTGPKEDTQVEYDSRWKKVSKINQNGFISNYEYDERGNLVKAFNSKKERVKLGYDRVGRIQEMIDADGKEILFKYGDQGKPVLITEKGVGTIRIQYDRDGRIQKTETVNTEKGRKPSEARSQEVVRQVMKGFQQLLNIIRPAGISIGTG